MKLAIIAIPFLLTACLDDRSPYTAEAARTECALGTHRIEAGATIVSRDGEPVAGATICVHDRSDLPCAENVSREIEMCVPDEAHALIVSADGWERTLFPRGAIDHAKFGVDHLFELVPGGVPAYDPKARYPRWLGAIRIDVGWPQARVVVDPMRGDAVYTGDDGYAYVPGLAAGDYDLQVTLPVFANGACASRDGRWQRAPVAAYTTTALRLHCSPDRSTP